MLNCVDGDHRNVHTLLDALGQVLFPALLKRIGLNDGPAGFITAGGDIQTGNANALQIPRDVLAFLFVHTIIPEIGSVHTNGDREVSAAGKANTHDNFCGETHAVEEVAAVFIRAVIGVRGHELIDQIAMSSVNFHTIEPGGLCNDSALDKTLHHGLDFCGRHFGTTPTVLHTTGEGPMTGLPCSVIGKASLPGWCSCMNILVPYACTRSTMRVKLGITFISVARS